MEVRYSGLRRFCKSLRETSLCSRLWKYLCENVIATNVASALFWLFSTLFCARASTKSKFNILKFKSIQCNNGTHKKTIISCFVFLYEFLVDVFFSHALRIVYYISKLKQQLLSTTPVHMSRVDVIVFYNNSFAS